MNEKFKILYTFLEQDSTSHSRIFEVAEVHQKLYFQNRKKIWFFFTLADKTLVCVPLLRTAKMTSYRNSAQNSDPWV